MSPETGQIWWIRTGTGEHPGVLLEPFREGLYWLVATGTDAANTPHFTAILTVEVGTRQANAMGLTKTTTFYAENFFLAHKAELLRGAMAGQSSARCPPNVRTPLRNHGMAVVEELANRRGIGPM